MKGTLVFLFVCFSLITRSQEANQKLVSRLDTTRSVDDRLVLVRKSFDQISKSSDSIQAEFYLRAGVTYGILGKLDSSIFCFEETIRKVNQTQYLVASRAYNGMGNVQRQVGNSEEALKSFLRAMETLENKDDVASKSFFGSINGNVAGIYFGIGDLDKAAFYSLRALESARLFNSAEDIAYSQVQLALIYAAQNDYDKALESHNEATKIIDEENIDYLRSYNQINLAKLYESRSELAEALEVYDEILQGNNPDIEVKTGTLENIAEILLKQGRHDDCIEHAEMLLKMAEANEMLPVAKAANRLLFDAHQQMGDFEVANSYLNEYLILNDSMLAVESFKVLSELETKYETEKKEQEITQLKLENQQAANQRNVLIAIAIIVVLGAVFLFILFQSKAKSNAIISRSLSEKETLLKEIHHRVKNNLQVISSLLSLQSRYIDDAKAQEAVNEGQNRVKSMALIHQKLYQHDNLLGVAAEEYIQNLTSALINAYAVDQDKIMIHYEVEDLRIDVDTIIPIGLILNELISNAFKHAFPKNEEGALSIHLKENEAFLEMIVQDNGTGADEKVVTSDSFGMRMIKSLATKLEAEVDFKFNKGTRAFLRISNYKLV